MGLFSKNDRISTLKKALKGAVELGNVQELKELLRTIDDLPRVHLTPALERAIANNQLESTKLLLQHNASFKDVSRGIIHNVVLESRVPMFRLLSEHGINFSFFTPTDDATSNAYRHNVRFLDKELECLKLKEEIAALRKELTDFRSVSPGQPAESAPVKPAGNSFNL